MKNELLTGSPESKIQSLLTALNTSLQLLDKSLNDHAARLSPVVTPYPVTEGGGADKGCPISPRSDVAGQVADSDDYVNKLTSRLQLLTSALEV